MDKPKRNITILHLLVFCTFILIFIGYKYEYFEIIPLRPPAFKKISSTHNHIKGKILDCGNIPVHVPYSLL